MSKKSTKTKLQFNSLYLDNQIINILEKPTKEKIKEAASNILVDTEYKIVSLFVLKELVKAIEDNFRETFPFCIRRYNESFRGCKIEESKGPSKYRYEEDPEYLNLKNKLKSREVLLKQNRDAFDRFVISNIGKKKKVFTGLVIDGEQIPLITKIDGDQIVKISIPSK